MVDVAWIDINYKQFKMNEIDDKYLLNIIRFVCRGGGHLYFVSAEKLKALFKETEKRGLEHPYDVGMAVKAIEAKSIRVKSRKSVYQ